ncbi:MAG: PAS domain-containing protein [Vallitaleaceae bacterium]|nr:PAS domain-containing protein [Vallitaleaceae bacterium]
MTEKSDQLIAFDAGSLILEEINAILNTLPLDMTFVDANNQVKYFTQGKERIFDRPKTIIGREVKNCHPPKSVHVVEQIVEDSICKLVRKGIS